MAATIDIPINRDAALILAELLNRWGPLLSRWNESATLEVLGLHEVQALIDLDGSIERIWPFDLDSESAFLEVRQAGERLAAEYRENH